MYQKEYCQGIGIVNQVLFKHWYWKKKLERYPVKLMQPTRSLSANVHFYNILKEKTNLIPLLWGKKSIEEIYIS